MGKTSFPAIIDLVLHEILTPGLGWVAVAYCGISTDCSAVVTCDGLEQMGGVFEIGVTV